YNYASYLGFTLDSVLAQEVYDLEVIVSDNCSTDASVALVNDYARRDARVKLTINNCNVGFAGNLQKATSRATGEWMTLLSSDDLLDTNFLSIYKHVIDSYSSEQTRYVILSSAQNVIDENGIVKGY